MLPEKEQKKKIRKTLSGYFDHIPRKFWFFHTYYKKLVKNQGAKKLIDEEVGVPGKGKGGYSEAQRSDEKTNSINIFKYSEEIWNSASN